MAAEAEPAPVPRREFTDPASRREFTLALVLGAAGAGLIMLALRQVWAHAVYTPPRPFPVQDLAVSGRKLVPLASALAIAALACLAAVIATRGVLRRVAGVLLAGIGAGAAVAATAAVTPSAVLSAALSADPAAGAFSGSTISGTTSGGSAGPAFAGLASGRAVISGLPWQAAAVTGALAIVLAGVAAAWRGTRWPVMSARFDRPGQRTQPHTADPAAMWESLNRDVDPTEHSQPGGLGGMASRREDQARDEVESGPGTR